LGGCDPADALSAKVLVLVDDISFDDRLARRW
jgi:hypothetical protein